MTAHAVTVDEVNETQVCEGCGRRLILGEIITPRVVGGEYGHDPYGLNSVSMGGTESDHDLSSGHHESEWHCADCLRRQR